MTRIDLMIGKKYTSILTVVFKRKRRISLYFIVCNYEEKSNLTWVNDMFFFCKKSEEEDLLFMVSRLCHDPAENLHLIYKFFSHHILTIMDMFTVMENNCILWVMEDNPLILLQMPSPCGSPPCQQAREEVVEGESEEEGDTPCCQGGPTQHRHGGGLLQGQGSVTRHSPYCITVVTGKYDSQWSLLTFNKGEQAIQAKPQNCIWQPSWCRPAFRVGPGLAIAGMKLIKFETYTVFFFFVKISKCFLF